MNSPFISTSKPVLGFICSAGGSVLEACWPLINESGVSLCIATDRDCGVEKKFQAKPNCTLRRFTYTNAEDFSKSCRDYFSAHGVEGFVGLYFTKFVSGEIFNTWSCINFHPTPLPLFPGLGSFEKLKQARVKTLGCTAHLVDGSCDAGLILSQVTNAAPRIDRWEKLIYLQKVYLLLIVIDHYLHGDFRSFASAQVPGGYINAQPGFLSKKFEDFYRELTHQEAMPIIGEAWNP